jgi:hypothetical protein
MLTKSIFKINTYPVQTHINIFDKFIELNRFNELACALSYDCRCFIYQYFDYDNLCSLKKVNNKMYTECIKYLYDNKYDYNESFCNINFNEKEKSITTCIKFISNYRKDHNNNEQLIDNYCEKKIIPIIMFLDLNTLFYDKEFVCENNKFIERINEIQSCAPPRDVKLSDETIIIISYLFLFVYKYHYNPHTNFFHYGFLNYDYIIRKIFKIIDLDKNSKFKLFMEINSFNTILNDNKWKQICEKANLPYISNK